MATATQPRRSKPAASYQTKMLIDGQFRDGVEGKTFATINPATEKEIAQVAEGTAADIDLAVKAARKAFDVGPWSKMDARDRGRLMYKLADLIEANIDDLAALESLDNGKPLKEARHGDLPLVVDCLRYYAGWADKLTGDTIPIRGNYFCYSKREPVGVVGQIIPWNFPMLMVAWKWGPALAAGCTVVMKPAEQTPLTALRMGELAMEAGFPAGVINIVPGFGEPAGAPLVAHKGVDKIAFTGSTEVGKIIMRNAAQTLKRVTLELGGKSPNIVFADADLDAAVDGAMLGLFLNQGQCCCAGSRLLVQDKIYDQMVDKLAAATEKRKVGDPFAADTDQGPQIDQTQFDKILGYIEKGKEQGARCVAGGERSGTEGYFIKPTVFADVKDEMDIAVEEIFGPVMQVLKFKDVDEVVHRANTTDYGLAAAVWSRDIAKAHSIADRLRAGTVWINCYDVFDAAAPFGGFKSSGIGRELGAKALDNYTEHKTVTVSLK
ncbi:aldehyde dehydrogenase family protein [Paludisphaera mucosa]|uniref:Aldehyde dehydrogenase family protein n=1 Tax=Paludisphaera mucosa TaxID=3030827 RepID=A0ABT6FAW0_9BACT|nr:aldehyde dehydrogenase family protein [Paludisphaera mucosa]MDG3004686.1 aldehyde dehydrogenase family protein [Paludisphaera mucosa]